MSKNKTVAKKYSEWTAEEKAAYKAKRVAYWKKRDEDAASAFAALEKELVSLKAGPQVMQLLSQIKPGKKDRSQRESGTSYLTQMFGTETPKKGQVASYLYIGIRGPQGERLNDGETMAQFVTRVGDCNYKYDANTIASMVWYLKKRGHVMINNREKATVTWIGVDAVVAE
jgi:hypothetical protein